MRGKKSAILTVVTADQINGAMQTNEGEDEKDVIKGITNHTMPSLF